MAWPYSWDWPVRAVEMPIFLVPLKDVWPLLVPVLPPQAATRVSAATARAAHRARLPIEGITGLALLLCPFGSRCPALLRSGVLAGCSSRDRTLGGGACRVWPGVARALKLTPGRRPPP